MPVDVCIPDDLGPEGQESSISTWFFADGDRVEQGDLIAEVMYEKSTNELLAPASGTLEILVAAEEAVANGQLVARIAEYLGSV
jgi:pyruvate/2-oxoglutarate dehydrogenase complex dihydrolipoamide acyltransferase (E2) component